MHTSMHQKAHPVMKVDLFLVRHKVHHEVEAALCIPDQQQQLIDIAGWTYTITRDCGNINWRCYMLGWTGLLVRTPAKEGVAAIRSQT